MFKLKELTETDSLCISSVKVGICGTHYHWCQNMLDYVDNCINIYYWCQKSDLRETVLILYWCQKSDLRETVESLLSTVLLVPFTFSNAFFK